MFIYKKYNQLELDLQYNIRFHVPDFENSLQQWETHSRHAEEKHKVIKDIPYGNEPRECLDIFPSAKPNSKTLVFIHGGYWQRFDKSNFHFIAGGFAKYEITTVLINYPLAPYASIDQIVASCRKAIDWVYKNIHQWNGDQKQIFLAGHSAGGHLSTMLMTKDKNQNEEMNIKGVCAISGLFNLIPVQYSYLNEVLKMDEEMATRNSPSELLPVENCPLIIAVGANETTEFFDQSRELFSNWKSKLSSLEYLEIPDLNHFTILNSIQDKNSLLLQSICRLMKI
jgi:arylformamidase